MNRFIKHTPYPKQGAALVASMAVGEVLFGGAAMGGKSDAALMAALQFADMPGYSAIIFRRTYPMLKAADGLIPRSKEWLFGTGAKWNEQNKTWTFPAGGTLAFSHMLRENDKYDHQGARYHFIGFEEVTHFTESQYLYLQSRQRRTKDEVIPLRTFSTCNPGGVGHKWVRSRFVDQRVKGRLFIPSRVEDNLGANVEEYDAQLRKLGEVEYRRLRHGDWDVEEGDVFNRADFKIQSRAPSGLRWVRFWDLAATAGQKGDYTAGVKMAIDDAGNIWIADVVKGQWSWPEAESVIVQTAQSDGVGVHIGVETISGFKIAAADLARHRALFRHTIDYIKHVTGDKVARCGPWASRARNGKLYLVAGHWNTDFIDEAVSFPGGRYDDQMDGASGAYGLLTEGDDAAWLRGFAG